MVRRKVTPEVLEEMRRLRGEGMTYREIAGRLGLSKMTVHRHLRPREAGSLEELAGGMRRWEPAPRATRRDVSLDSRAIDIPSWAAGHFEGHRGVDLYVNEEGTVLGVKPAAEGQRSLAPRRRSRGFQVACAPLMRELGVERRVRAPAEWSERRKMLLIDLRGIAGRKGERE